MNMPEIRDRDDLGDLSLLGARDDSLEPSAPAVGAALPPFRRSLSMLRTRFETALADGSTATVDVDHSHGRASLYRGGRHVLTSSMPVRFEVDAQHIEVDASRYGMRRIHLIGADGAERRLDPAPGTPEHSRADLARRRPRLSRAVAIAAVVVLAVNLTLLAPQLLEMLTHSAVWADRLPPFTSPVDLPVWVNTALGVAVAAAGLERALSFRHNRLLDAETDVIDA